MWHPKSRPVPHSVLEPFPPDLQVYLSKGWEMLSLPTACRELQDGGVRHSLVGDCECHLTTGKANPWVIGALQRGILSWSSSLWNQNGHRGLMSCHSNRGWHLRKKKGRTRIELVREGCGWRLIRRVPGSHGRPYPLTPTLPRMSLSGSGEKGEHLCTGSHFPLVKVLNWVLTQIVKAIQNRGLSV